MFHGSSEAATLEPWPSEYPTHATNGRVQVKSLQAFPLAHHAEAACKTPPPPYLSLPPLPANRKTSLFPFLQESTNEGSDVQLPMAIRDCGH